MAVDGQSFASNKAGEVCRKLGHKNLTQTAQSVYASCKGQQQILTEVVQSGLRVAERTLAGQGRLHLDEKQAVSWTAVHQLNKQAQPLSLPRLMVGDHWLGQVRNARKKAPIVDAVREQVGGVATIFQRMNERGDMLRVCTNIKKKDGQRAIGTYIPATNPDGQPNPVISAILAGRTLTGRTFVVDSWYLSAYKPLKDNAGKVIGALYFGQPMETTSALRKALASIQIGESGYVFVLDSEGTCVVAKNPRNEGKNLWDLKDLNGDFFIRDIVRAAKSSDPAKPAIVEYSWRNSPSEPVQRKVAHCLYFEPWDWAIGVGAYVEEFEASARAVAEVGHEETMGLLALALIAGVVATVLFLWSARRITGPLGKAVAVAQQVALGELSVRMDVSRDDEVGHLGSALNSMCEVLQGQAQVARDIAEGDLTVQPKVSGPNDELGNALQGMVTRLRKLVSEIQSAASHMRNGTREISKASLELSDGATRQAASLEEIGSSVAELNLQASNTAEGARSADDNSSQAAKQSLTGQKQMEELTAAMHGISDSSQKISNIIKVIDDIAFQTNLLALNAAVEAARAGQHGKGFAVVAEEVRALASRSARAAQETTQLIEASLSQVRTGEEITSVTSESLVRIAERVQETSKLVSEISQANEEGARGLSEIRDALSQIDAVTQQNAASSEETSSAVQALDSQTDGLQQLLTRFRV